MSPDVLLAMSPVAHSEAYTAYSVGGPGVSPPLYARAPPTAPMSPINKGLQLAKAGCSVDAAQPRTR